VLLAAFDGPDGIIVLVIVLVLVFGGSAIPKLARNLGSAKTEFEKGLKASKNGEAPAGESKETPPPSSPTDTDTPS
jgi:sec-independent protein translocase protein TatA